ncbi:hypothetical protein [Burkholderia ubonensis]|uniref:Phosphoglycerate mutase n=1 Tax=Burkholderia ubonensis TaxID=101571 RepID=A0ABD4EA92_9BURK|nr:hypothetical protein [Burkholderia ubonensis]KVN92574.1 hypothetical protein WJ68_33680 [Burkholderia ubonensis]
MTPEQKIKHLILIRHAELNDQPVPQNVTTDTVDELYDAIDEPWDARNEVRCSGEETGLPTPCSRHYEVDAVARQYLDGSWIGWNYFYGGGKHGEPEAIDWIEDAYDVVVTGETTIIKRQFAKAA